MLVVDDSLPQTRQEKILNFFDVSPLLWKALSDLAVFLTEWTGFGHDRLVQTNMENKEHVHHLMMLVTLSGHFEKTRATCL